MGQERVPSAMSMFSNLRGLGAGKKPADGEMPPSPGDNADGYDGEMSRADLLAQIQVLLDKNTRFETRFRDVVAAYKSLLKENDALKSTVSALTGGDNRAPAGENGPSNAASTEPHATATAAEAADGGESSAEDGSSQAPPPEASEPAPATADLQRQLTALKTAVRTITEEKANITSQFQRDKKTVAEAQRAALAKQRRAHEESEAKLKQLLNQQEEEKVLLQGQVEALTQQVLDGHAASREAEAAWEKQRAALREEMAEVRSLAPPPAPPASKPPGNPATAASLASRRADVGCRLALTSAAVVLLAGGPAATGCRAGARGGPAAGDETAGRSRRRAGSLDPTQQHKWRAPFAMRR